MTDRTENCKECGRPILPVTKAATGGYCRGCDLLIARAAAEVREAQYLAHLSEPLNVADLHSLMDSAGAERLCSEVLNRLFSFYDADELTHHQALLLSAETFHGECCNGGFEQFIFNQPARFITCLPEALREFELTEYYPIAEKLLEIFNGNIPSDKDTLSDQFNSWVEKHEDDAEAIDDLFFSKHDCPQYERSIRLRMASYILKNADTFTFPKRKPSA